MFEICLFTPQGLNLAYRVSTPYIQLAPDLVETPIQFAFSKCARGRNDCDSYRHYGTTS